MFNTSPPTPSLRLRAVAMILALAVNLAAVATLARGPAFNDDVQTASAEPVYLGQLKPIVVYAPRVAMKSVPGRDI